MQPQRSADTLPDAELVQLFQQRLGKLVNSTFGQEVASGKFNAVDIIQYHDGTTGIRFASTHPDTLDAFILHYRVLTQDNDPMSLRNMAPIIKRTASPEMFSSFETARSQLNSYLDTAALYSPGNVVKTHREFIEVILYGVHAHTDLGKYSKFKLMEAAEMKVAHHYRGTGDSLMGMFLYHLQEVVVRMKHIQNAIAGLKTA